MHVFLEFRVDTVLVGGVIGGVVVILVIIVLTVIIIVKKVKSKGKLICIVLHT